MNVTLATQLSSDLLLIDDAAVTVCVDLAAQQLRHRLSQCRCAGQHDSAEFDDAGASNPAGPGTAGFRCRSHTTKPYARASTDVRGNSEPASALFMGTLWCGFAENILESTHVK